mgnify:CR=1 FL=1
MIIGASFSHPHLEYLKINPQNALKEFKKLGFRWIRLGCYWNEIEKTPGKFNFKKIISLMNFCQKNRINVILTIGMKAPRYPEYYLPLWIDQSNLGKLSKIGIKNKTITQPLYRFIKQSVLALKNYSCLKVWQVENEPLSPAGKNHWRISLPLLKEEINLVKNLDKKRKILLNYWGEAIFLPKLLESVRKLEVDIIGFDTYFKTPINIPLIKKTFYHRAFSPKKIRKLTKQLKEQGKEVWIAELQAEPWEPGELITKKSNPPSFSPQDLGKNLQKAINWEVDGILFWGFEYWLWRKISGDARYWQQAETNKIIRRLLCSDRIKK